MSRFEISEKVISLMNSILEIPIDTDCLDKNLLLLGFNSLSFLKVLIQVEDVFNFEFDEDDIHVSNFNSINDLVLFIEEKTE